MYVSFLSLKKVPIYIPKKMKKLSTVLFIILAFVSVKTNAQLSCNECYTVFGDRFEAAYKADTEETEAAFYDMVVSVSVNWFSYLWADKSQIVVDNPSYRGAGAAVTAYGTTQGYMDPYYRAINAGITFNREASVILDGLNVCVSNAQCG